MIWPHIYDMTYKVMMYEVKATDYDLLFPLPRFELEADVYQELEETMTWI